MSTNEIKLKITIDGKEAIATLDATQNDLTNLTKTIRDANNNSKTFSDNIVHAFAQARNLFQGLNETISVFKQVLGGQLNEYMNAEAAMIKLETALKQTNQYTNQNIEDLKNYSSQLQEMTIYGDDATQTIMAQLVAMGLNIEQTKKAALLSADLATIMGTDLNAAAKVMGDLFAGDATMINRYVKGLDESILKSGDLNKIIEMLNERIGGQAKAIGDSASGSLAKMNNAIGDLKENAGELISKALSPIVKVIADIIGSINNLSPYLSGLIGAVGSLTAAFITLQITGIGGAVKSIFTELIPAIASATTKFFTMQTMLGSAGWLTLGFAAVAGGVFYLTQKINENAESIKQHRKAVDDAYPNWDKSGFGGAKPLQSGEFTWSKSDIINNVKNSNKVTAHNQGTGVTGSVKSGNNQTRSKNNYNTNIDKKDMLIYGLDEPAAKSMADIFIAEDVRRFNEFKNIKELEVKASEEAAYAKLRVEQDTNEMIQQTVEETERAKLEMAQGTLQNIASLFAQHTVAYKVFSIAQATIDTYKAATAALGTPPVGPWNIAFAASIIAAGLANVAKIVSTKVGFAQGGLLPAGKAGIVEGWHNEIIAPEKTFIDVFKSELRPKIYNSLAQDNNIDKIINKLDNWQKEITFKIKGNDLVTSYDRNKNNQLIYSY